MCTWSGSRCPSSIRLSFCSASLRNTSPKYFRNSPYNAFRRPFGINTTWYLHSHFEWLKLSYSSIQFLLCVCFAAHAWSLLDGLPYLSNFACLPGRAGGTPISLALDRVNRRFLQKGKVLPSGEASPGLFPVENELHGGGGNSLDSVSSHREPPSLSIVSFPGVCQTSRFSGGRSWCVNSRREVSCCARCEAAGFWRSEERRVGKEGRTRW